MSYRIDYEKSIANKGDASRLKECMSKAVLGGSITVGFLGGSITQGSLASSPSLCYASLVHRWWVNRFPQAEINYCNAGIGGTTSHFGVARVDDDLLIYSPDVVIVEYSVNDEEDDFYLETYEGLIRRIYGSKNQPAVVIVHNVRYNDGGNAQRIHQRIGEHYGIPCISMQSSIYPLVASGKLDKEEITPDDLHPNDVGHAMIAEIVTKYFEQVYDEYSINVDQTIAKEAFDLPAPITANAYEVTRRYQNYNAMPELLGFAEDHTKQETITEFFRNGWEACNVGDTIRFTIESTGIAIQYRKTIYKPAPVAEVVIDGDEDNKVILDGNFEENWGDCLYLQNVIIHGEKKTRTIEVRICSAQKEDILPFYLVSVIAPMR